MLKATGIKKGIWKKYFTVDSTLMLQVDMRIDGKITSENSIPQPVILICGQGFNQNQTIINAMNILGLGN